MLTIALAIQTQNARRMYWLRSNEPDRALTGLLLFVITLITLGLAADLVAGLPLGTLAIWPTAIAAGAALGAFFWEGVSRWLS